MSKRKSKKLLEQASDAVDDIKPVVENSLESAYETAKEAISDGREAASHAFDEVSSETKRRFGRKKKEKKRKKLRVVLLLGIVAAAAAVVAKALRSDQDAPWAASSSPAPANTPAPPTPVTPAAPTSGAAPDDRGGAAPGEALSDASDEGGAHTDSTPDEPAEVVDLDKPDTKE